MNRKQYYKKNVTSTNLVGTSSGTDKRPVREHTASESSCSSSSLKITTSNANNNKDISQIRESSSSASSSQHHSSSSIEKLDENYFGSFQEHYEYLMDKGLIETCQVGAAVSANVLSPPASASSNNASPSLTKLCENESMSGNVSFKEFLHQYNELNKWLEQMLSFNSESMTSHSEKYTNQVRK